MSCTTFYGRQNPTPGHQQPSKRPARALDESEREEIGETLASPRFVDRSPAEVVATPLDEGHPVRERRNQLTHLHYAKPELAATAPNQTRSWDINPPLT